MLLTAKPTLRVCTGTVCTKYGALNIYESASALASAGAADVDTAMCLNECEKLVAVRLNGDTELLDASKTPFEALDLVSDAYESVGLSCGALGAAFSAKLAGDQALTP